MTSRTLFAVCAVAAALAGGSAITASAFDKTTYLTFTETVTIPGATLTPGTYIFERVTTDDSLVRVMSRDRSHVYLTQFTHPVYRPAGLSDDPVVIVSERERNQSPRVQVWYPANSVTGQEFVYR
jgi:hypothetical protein